MRCIVYGVGAIGGTVASALCASGQEVVGIARGAQLAAIRDGGMTLATPGGPVHTRFECVGDPTEIALRPDDMVLLAMKSQDTQAALVRLRAAGLKDQPIFCLQNGIANEAMALRYSPNVHGVTVMMPGTYVSPGTVAIHAAPRYGIFDLGRYPQGRDADDTRFAAAMEQANIAAFILDDVMASKRGKLLMNLGNILEAALGRGTGRGDIAARARAEGEAVLAAARLAWVDVGADDPRRDAFMKMADIAGSGRLGGSTTQSLIRGTGSLETDYLNGEIAYLGRCHGVPTPVNAFLTVLAARLAETGAAPGHVSLAALLAGAAAFEAGGDWMRAMAETP